MTFNIHAGQGDLTRVAEVIRSADADVVALQEVDVHWGERSGFRDQAADLAEAAGMAVRFGPIYVLPGADPTGPPMEYGVAILTRLPALSWRNHEITRLSTQSDAAPGPMPGFLQVTVDVSGTAVDVFSTHLDFRPDPTVRRAQVADMLTVMGASTRPVLLLGDLNAPPDAPELEPLFAAFLDAWTAAAPGGTPATPGGPAGGEAGATYPADAPIKRIDYVLVSPDLGVRDARVVGTLASDHRPVVATVVVPRR
jgi:endonuclease/exonuclease/phosphatase family metal-dependent hydrolase